MDGFLPLVEGFLAFALTILALTTAVSALVGTVQRLLRWRPRVLREMVDFFYRNEVQDLIEELGKVAAAGNGGSGGDNADPPEASSAAGPAKGAQPTDPLAAFLDNPGDAVFRRRFVAHMTLLPAVLLGPNGKPDREAREKVIQKTDPQRDEDWLDRARHRWEKWRWLKPVLD